MANKGIKIHKPKTKDEFNRLNNELTRRGFVALDVLKRVRTGEVSLGDKDPASAGARDMAATMGCGSWSNGPLAKVAWQFDAHNETVVPVNDKDGNALGPGYVKWGAGDNIPSTIPPLAMSSPYTAAPLRYLADLTAGLGPALMYRFPDSKLVDFKDAGEILRDKVEELEGGQKENKALKRAREALAEWERTWYGEEETDELGITTHVIGIKEFLEENNLNLHLSQCMQDDVMLDIYFPTVGFSTWGTRRQWKPKINRVGFLTAAGCRLGKMSDTRHIDWAYYSESLRTKGTTGVHTVVSPDQNRFVMYPAAMPQHMLGDLRYIVSSHQRGRIKDRPMWVVCPTFYPSLNKPYYPQPAWWSVFTSKAFDFSATILYDKYKQRENNTSWGKLLFISLDYLDRVFGDSAIQGNPEKQQEFIDQLDQQMDDFLQHRENHGKYMRQWMWEGTDGKEHHNVEIVDIKDAINDEAKAGKEELELSTSPIFLALQVDPRLVGVPMVQASNGGTALREMALLKQQQLNPKQRLYLQFLNSVLRFNGWDNDGCAEFQIKQQTLTTLDNSKTGIVETIAGEKN